MSLMWGTIRSWANALIALTSSLPGHQTPSGMATRSHSATSISPHHSPFGCKCPPPFLPNPLTYNTVPQATASPAKSLLAAASQISTSTTAPRTPAYPTPPSSLSQTPSAWLNSRASWRGMMTSGSVRALSSVRIRDRFMGVITLMISLTPATGQFMLLRLTICWR
jgi:hypothetical protein